MQKDRFKTRKTRTIELNTLPNDQWEVNGVNFSQEDLDLFLGSFGYHVEYPDKATRFYIWTYTMNSLCAIAEDEFDFMLEIFKLPASQRQDVTDFVMSNRMKYEALQLGQRQN